MDLSYNLDIDEKSCWYYVTPSLEAQTFLFRVSEAGHFRAGPRFFTDRTGKEEFYLLYTHAGHGILRHHGQTLSLEKHRAVMIYCHEHQYYATTSDEPWDHYWIHFNGPQAQNYYDIINDDGIANVYIEDTHSYLSHLQGILDNRDTLDMRQSVLSAMHVTYLLSMMVGGKFTPLTTGLQPHHQEKLEQVLNFIHEHHREQINLEDLAAVAHLSVSHFMRLFKQYTGMAPHEYLVNHRVNQAKKILRDTTIPIGEVGYLVGFGDNSNFSRTFKRVAGTTPQNFRKMRN